MLRSCVAAAAATALPPEARVVASREGLGPREGPESREGLESREEPRRSPPDAEPCYLTGAERSGQPGLRYRPRAPACSCKAAPARRCTCCWCTPKVRFGRAGTRTHDRSPRASTRTARSRSTRRGASSPRSSAQSRRQAYRWRSGDPSAQRQACGRLGAAGRARRERRAQQHVRDAVAATLRAAARVPRGEPRRVVLTRRGPPAHQPRAGRAARPPWRGPPLSVDEQSARIRGDQPHRALHGPLSVTFVPRGVSI